MTRHGKNSTASSVYTYHERRRDAKASGYGTLHARLGADSIKEFHCCSLTLQPCRNPVISHTGYIFDRQAILENILAQKKAYAKKLKEYEKQMSEESAAKQSEGLADVLTKRSKFSAIESTPSRTGAAVPATPIGESGALKRSAGVMSTEIAAKVKAHGEEGDMSNMRGEKSTALPSFWIPELNPTAAASKLEKPSSKTLCPVSGKSIKMKDMLEVIFTPMPGTETSAKRRYVCPVTRDELTNTTRCAYLKKSKSVVKYDVIEKLIKGDGVDPISGEPMTEDDIIELQRGGTGYAATNEVKAKLIRPQLELQ
uniref:Nitric oxide synthase-interacting protein homolog n=1 Tax=Caenorhabditis japonica TaxID=281687 RepID=A0A8R1HMN6_CAEJA